MTLRTSALIMAFLLILAPVCGAGENLLKLRLSVTSVLPIPNVPLDPEIDFPSYIREAGLDGRVDPNSIRVVDVASGENVPCAVTEDFAYGDKGRVEWVAKKPEGASFEIRFNVVKERPALRPASNTPMIGVGDLLRYNAGEPRPFVLAYMGNIVDLTGDGVPDLVGCWNYAYRPGRPWNGIICYPGIGDPERFEFGDLVHVRYVDSKDSRDFKHFSAGYMTSDCADLNKDGLPDIVFSPNTGDRIYFYLNTGERDDGGMPIFAAAGDLSRGSAGWTPCRAVDMNNDGALDFVVGSTYFKNMNPAGWPVAVAEGVALNIEKDPSETGYGAHCFFDVDGDGRLDAITLEPRAGDGVHDYLTAWRRNSGGDPPVFEEAKPVDGIDAEAPVYLAAVTSGARKGIIVLHDVYQSISFFEHEDGAASFRRSGQVRSISSVMSLSDQAWPYICDWDNDGDWDLLIGGGYGWPRIALNSGGNERPAFETPKSILSNGVPIRILRDEVFGSKYWHNMGYPLPAFVDWDGDSLSDLLLPNETNRIFWFKNVGTKERPEFGERRQLIVDGYPDGPDSLARSLKRIEEQNTPYPLEEEQPFFWRTGAAFADYNGDGFMDLITLDGATRKAALFVQYKDADGALRLRKEGQLHLADGRLIDDSIVERGAHWTESFRAADWDSDGLTDLIYSCAGTEASKGSIYFLRNCGDKSKAVFENPVTLCCFGEPIKVTDHGPHPAVGDVDGDGKPDIIACVEWSVYPFYSHAALSMTARPSWNISLER